MNQTISAAVRAAGLLGLLAGATLAGPAPASAASGTAWTPTNEAYALSASGRLTLDPVGEASYSGGSPVVLPNADAAGLLGTGIITDRAGATSAAASIPSPAVTLPRQVLLRATAISSSCQFSSGTRRVTGTTRITAGRIIRPGQPAIRLAASPAPNTRIVLPGVAVILLNRQFTGPRGTLTVMAMRIRMLRGHQKLLLATTLCAAASLAPPPALSGAALRLTLGGLGLAVLGGIGYQLSRRRRLAAPAGP